MTITLTNEQELIIQAQLAAGQFQSVEDLLDKVLNSLRPPSVESGKEENIARAQAAAERILELRKGIKLDRPDGMTLREYAHIGHKY